MQVKEFEGKRLLTVEETAKYLGISPKTVRNQLSLGRFPLKPKRVGKAVRFDRRDLNEFVDRL